MPTGLASALVTAWQFDRLFARAQKLARAGSTSEAEDLFKAAASLRPQNQHVHLHLALCLAERGRYKEALAETARLTRRHPQNAVFHLFHGRILFDSSAFRQEVSPNQLGVVERQNLLGALHSFEQAHRLAPDNSLARGYLLLCRMALGELRGALEELRASRIPGNPEYQARLLILLEKLVPAKPSLDGAGRMQELEKKPGERKISKQSRRDFSLEPSKQSRRDFSLEPSKQSRRDFSLEPRAPSMRKALRLAEEFKFAEAADAVWEILLSRPSSSEERMYYAAFSVLARRYKAAAEALNGANRADPEVALWLGCAMVGLGQINEGLRLLETADNRWAETRYFRGLALLARNKALEALREFAAAVELDWTLAHRRVNEALLALSS
ncbi:MAG: tetratricopeptide repeat protein [Armatimonadota bacterium]